MLGCLLLGVLTVQAVFPGSITLAEQHAESSVTFSADRRAVFSPGDCIALTWSAEQIREIYLNDRPTSGLNGERFCLSAGTLPTLRVIYMDDTAQVFTLPIMYLIDRPELWIVMMVAISAWIFGGALLLLERRAAHARSYTASAGATAAPHRISLLSVIGAVTVILVLVGGSGEVLLRAYFTAFGSEEQQIRYLLSEKEIHLARANILWVSEVGFVLSPFNPVVNTLGYRGEDIAIPKPEDVFRIVALGGSSTYGFAPPELTYPAQLERILREDYGFTNVEVINAGTPAYNSFNIVASFQTRVLELEPDLAIFSEASNDVGAREVDPNCYRGMNIYRGLNPRTSNLTSSGSRLSPSVLYRFISINLGWELEPLAMNADVVMGADVIDCGWLIAGDPAANVAQNPPVYYRRNLTTLIAVANAFDVDLLLSTWAYDETSGEPQPYWREAVTEHNAIVTELAAEYGVPYIDYAEIAPQGDAMWGDYVHMRAEGLQHQAETYAAYLVEQGLIPGS